eukprot:8995300-Pyramimonas_sp.AAC.2
MTRATLKPSETHTLVQFCRAVSDAWTSRSWILHHIPLCPASKCCRYQGRAHVHKSQTSNVIASLVCRTKLLDLRAVPAWHGPSYAPCSNPVPLYSASQLPCSPCNCP